MFEEHGDDGLCKCGNSASEEEHSCPYSEGLGDTCKTCNCCDDCIKQCELDL